MYVWIKDGEITAFCEEKPDGTFPEEYGEMQETNREVIHIKGKIYFADSDEAVALLKEQAIEEARIKRDVYLSTYVDPIVTNPLRWSELTEEGQNQYKEYRQYLLDIPQQENFPDAKILTFEEWKESNSSDNIPSEDVESEVI